jgi:hypothetical protein
MKAILEFNLPEDEKEMKDAINGKSWRLLAYEFSQFLRTEIKYNDKHTDDERATFKRIQAEFNNIMMNDNLSLD